MSIDRVWGIPIAGLDRIHGITKAGLDRIHGLSGVPADDGGTPATLPTPDAYWRFATADASGIGIADLIAGRELTTSAPYGFPVDTGGLYDSALANYRTDFLLATAPISANLTYPADDTVVTWAWFKLAAGRGMSIRIGLYIAGSYVLSEDELSAAVTVGIGSPVALSAPLPDPAEWHLIGLIRTTENVRVYLDGAVRATATPADLSLSNTHYQYGCDGPTMADITLDYLSDVGIIIGEDDPVGVLDALWNSGVGMVYRSGSWVDPGEVL